MSIVHDIPGNSTYIAIENGPFIVDLPSKDCDFPKFVCLPEGIQSGKETFIFNKT